MGDFMIIKLIDAAQRGDMNELEFCLKLGGVDLNSVNESGITALIAACLQGNVQCVKRLLEEESLDVNKTGSDGKTALFVACQKGFREIVQELLKRPGIEVNTQDKFSTTALMVALRARMDEIIGLLLKHPGIDVNQQKKDGTTALMYAVTLGHGNVVRELLKRSDVVLTLTNKSGQTALDMAKKKRLNEMTKLLEDYRARKQSRQSSVRSGATSRSNRTLKRYTDTLKRNSSLSHLSDQSGQSDKESKEENVESTSKQKTVALSTMIRMKSQQESSDVDGGATAENVAEKMKDVKLTKKPKNDVKAEKVTELLHEVATQKRESIVESEPVKLEAVERKASVLSHPSVVAAPLQSDPTTEPTSNENAKVSENETKENPIKDEVEVVQDVAPKFVGPEYETEVGKVLVESDSGLDGFCEAFYKNNVKKIFAAANLTDFELEHNLAIKSKNDRDTILSLFATRPEAKQRRESHLGIFVASASGSKTKEVFDEFAAKSIEAFNLAENLNISLDDLLEKVEHSSTFVCITSKEYFMKASPNAESEEFGSVFKNVTALIWAYIHKVDIVGVKSAESQAPALFKLVLRQGGELLSSNEWDALQKYNISYPNLYDAIEHLSKNIVKDTNELLKKMFA